MITKVNDSLIQISGRIDSANSAVFETELFEAVDCNNALVLDIAQLEYISSAGLRVLMKFQKSAGGKVSIINASNEVYEVFDMTGFTKLMNVSKALRELSVDGCEIIGQGGNGAVYRIDSDTIIKVYKNTATLDKIMKERNYAQAAFVHGIPTAISYDTVRVGDCYGIVFELLDATTVGKAIMASPEKISYYGRKMGKLLKILHSTEMDEGVLPKMSDKISGWIDYMEDMKYLGADDIALMRDVLSKIPERNTIVHSDFHEGNVMVQDGELILIDLDDICTGHPVYDLAMNYMSHVLAQSSPHIIRKSLNLEPQQALEVRQHTLFEYFGIEDKSKIEIIDKTLGAMAMFISSFVPAKSKDSTNMTPEVVQGVLAAFVPRFREAAPALPDMIKSLGL